VCAGAKSGPLKLLLVLPEAVLMAWLGVFELRDMLLCCGTCIGAPKADMADRAEPADTKQHSGAGLNMVASVAGHCSHGVV
jgi:hypothetical protein